MIQTMLIFRQKHHNMFIDDGAITSANFMSGIISYLAMKEAIISQATADSSKSST